MEDNKNTQQQNDNGGQQNGEKLFTQDELNRIIGERLARVKTAAEPDMQEKERTLNQRELMLDAREMLADAGLPKELLSVINCSSKEDVEKSISTLQAFMTGNNMPEANKNKTTYRVSTGTSGSSNGSGKLGGANDPAAIRKAMGLKG